MLTLPQRAGLREPSKGAQDETIDHVGIGRGPRDAGAGGQTKQEAPGTTDFDKQMAQVQENMRAMQEQMDRIRQTEDPQARQKLLQDHWTTMQNNMQMMHGMWAPGMMGCCEIGRAHV